MANAAEVQPGFWNDAKTVEVSGLARLLYIGLSAFADVNSGRMPHRAAVIRAQVFPNLEDDISVADVEQLLGELSGRGMIYLDDDDELEVLGWKGE